MDDDIISPEFNVFSNNRYIKTYSKVNKNISNVNPKDNAANNTTKPVMKNDPLTTKNAIQFLLDGTLKYKVCRYCLNMSTNLSELDQYLEVNGQGALYKVTIRDMVASFHPVKVVHDLNLPDKICNKCLDRTISAYLFTQQCERAERALRNCIEDMYDKLIKLDPMERPKKRGRQKLNPNYNILYAEHKNVIQYAEPLINIINTSSQSLTTEEPIKDYECLKCCQVLPTVDALLNHEKSHPKSMWYNCRLCGKSFPKRYLLKKHANTHLVEKPRKPSDNSFPCNHCGNVSKDCNEYLQHIEKHKFKVLMEHLVEKNMDELCSVCLNKSSKMTKLNSMVCLHGGHSDMAGDRSLYNILASTIPDPKLHKYQELIIPREAQIMTIVKKDKNPIHHVIKQYFSRPIILTTDKINFDGEYIFFFSSPLKEIFYFEGGQEIKISELPIEYQNLDTVKDIDDAKVNSDMANIFLMAEFQHSDVISDLADPKQTSNLPVISEYDDLHDKTKVKHDKVTDTTNMDVFVQVKHVFMFSKPIYLDKNDNRPSVGEVTDELNKKHINDNPKPCKVCWIFKGKACEGCGKNQDKTKPCNYCWLFECLDTCEYCKNPTKTISDVEIENINIEIARKASNKIYMYKDSESANTNSFEAATFKELNGMEKKAWQCSICLTTNNANKHTWICCECDLNRNDFVKISFGQYSTLFNEINKGPFEIQNNNTEKNVEMVNATTVVTSDKNDTCMQSDAIDTIQDMDIEPVCNGTDSGGENYKLEVPECSSLIMNYFAPEKMDVEEIMKDDITPSTFSDSKQVANPFQFSIGSVSSEDKCVRKFKRPVRKMSRASHK